MMRPYRPTYPEGCSQQPGTYPGGDAPSVRKTEIFGANIVHSAIDAEGVPEAKVDVATRTRQADATQSLADLEERMWFYPDVSSAAMYETLTRKFARGGQAEMENDQAASQSLADLEERIWFYPDVSSAAMRRLSSHG